MMNNLNWLEQWYLKQCDGCWEHHYGVTIETLDNPGWSLSIDLTDTILENLISEYVLFDKGEDWFSFKIEDNTYDAAGDPGKLDVLIGLFKHIYSIHNIPDDIESLYSSGLLSSYGSE